MEAAVPLEILRVAGRRPDACPRWYVFQFSLLDLVGEGGEVQSSGVLNKRDGSSSGSA